MKLKIWNVFEEKNIHKLFLVLGLSLGTMLCLFMPLFNEPDGQYHLAVSGRIAGSIVDTSRYDEYIVTSGMSRQKTAYKSGTHFKKYYLNKANFVDVSALPRNIRYSVLDFVFWGHLVPAIGLFIGKLIYPSLGIMLTVARFTSLLICITSIHFIIKHLKAAKMIYFLIFLSPVALNSFASLSYDATGFVIVGLFLCFVINTIVDKNITKKRRYQLYISAFLLVIATKWNYWLLIVWLPFLEYQYNPKSIGLKKRFKSFKDKLLENKILLALFVASLFVLFLMLAVQLTQNHGGLFVVIRRYLMTFGYNYSGLGLHNNDLTSWLSSPYPEFNFMPTWTTSVWYLFFFLTLLSEEKFVIYKKYGYFSLFIFLTGVLGVFYIMLDYNGARTSYIEGVQGRYFTPTLVLLQLFFSAIKPALNDSGKKVVIPFVSLLVIVSSILLLFDTLIALIMR